MTRFLVLIAMIFTSRFAIATPEPTIEIRGNRAVTADVIRAYIQAQQPTLIEPSGVINQEAIERATLLVSAFYWDLGYAKVNVAEALVDDTNHRVTFRIKDEGPKFTISTIRVTGDLLRTERSFLASLATKPSSRFSRSSISSDREKLQRYYEDRSYANVSVLPLTKVDLATTTIALNFEIKKGEPCFIEKIKIAGNTKTTTQEILDLLSIKQGESFHGTRVEASRTRLRASGKFNDVILVVRKGSTDAAIEIVFEVDE